MKIAVSKGRCPFCKGTGIRTRYLELYLPIDKDDPTKGFEFKSTKTTGKCQSCLDGELMEWLEISDEDSKKI